MFRERERVRKELIPWGEKKQRKEELCKESVRTFRLALRPSLSLLHSQFLSFFFSLFLFLFIFCISHTNREKIKIKKALCFLFCGVVAVNFVKSVSSVFLFLGSIFVLGFLGSESDSEQKLQVLVGTAIGGFFWASPNFE